VVGSEVVGSEIGWLSRGGWLEVVGSSGWFQVVLWFRSGWLEVNLVPGVVGFPALVGTKHS
jgi:hypothetical protein